MNISLELETKVPQNEIEDVNPDAEKSYNLIADAIDYIRANFKDQPDLNTIADEFGYHPHHFQRLFKNWAGISPKKFLEYTTLQAAQQNLLDGSLLELSINLGLSSTSRLYELFVRWEAMTPGEFRKRAGGLTIEYFAAQGPFGWSIVGTTERGVCYIGFGSSKAECINQLTKKWPLAQLKAGKRNSKSASYFTQIFFKKDGRWQIPLYIMGTEFQVQVWRSLLNIDCNAPLSYGQVAALIGNAGGSRAVGSAVGKNPVAYLIPCHRVLKGDGSLGGYGFGPRRKQVMLVHEGLSPWQAEVKAAQ